VGLNADTVEGEAMSKVRTILAPVDFSDTSRHALEYARDLAEKLGAKLTILHVYDVPNFTFPEGSYIPTAEEAARIGDAAQKALAEVVAETVGQGGTEVVSKLRQGSPAHEILDEADSGDATMIVMGTHGRGFFSRALMGSVAQDVIRRASVPVLTVRGSEED
jgi:nucleotide-binding universal stress UspA family protein